MGTTKRLIKYFYPYKIRIFFGLTATAIMGFSDTILAGAIGLFFDTLTKVQTLISNSEPILIEQKIEYQDHLFYSFNISGQNELLQFILIFGLLIVALAIFKVIFVYAREYLMNSTSHKFLMQFRRDIFDRILLLPMKFFDSEKTGNIMARITNDVAPILYSLPNKLNTLSGQTISITVGIIIRLVISKVVCWASLAIILSVSIIY